jgi:hypothetical protein
MDDIARHPLDQFNAPHLQSLLLPDPRQPPLRPFQHKSYFAFCSLTRIDHFEGERKEGG